MSEPRLITLSDQQWLITDADAASPRELVRAEGSGGARGSRAYIDQNFELHVTGTPLPLVIVELLLDRARECCPECHSQDVTLTEQIFCDEITDPVTEEIASVEYVAPAHVCNACDFGWTGGAREHEQTEALFRFYGRRLRELAAELKRESP